MRTMALELVLLLAAANVCAQSQTTFKFDRSTHGDDPEETHRIIAKAATDIETIATAVGDGNEEVDEVFIRSRNAIARIGARGPKGVPELRSILTDSSKNWKVKAMICEALGKIKGNESAATLSAVLVDNKQHEFVRAVAGDKLALLGRPEDEPVIKQTVSDKSVPIRVRERTMMSVGLTGLNDVDWLKDLAIGNKLGLSKDRNKPITQEESGLMRNAQRALGKSKNPKAFDALLELQEKYPTNGIYTEMIATKRDPRAIPVLIKTLTYKNPHGFTSDAMILAANTLGEMKAIQAASSLADIIENDKNPLFVAAAAKALAAIDPGQGKRVIEKLLASLPNDDRFRVEKHPAFWSQEKAGWGPIYELKKSINTSK